MQLTKADNGKEPQTRMPCHAAWCRSTGLKRFDIVFIKRKAPARTLRNHRAAAIEFDRFVVERRKPRHVLEIHRIGQATQYLKAHFAEEMARYRDVTVSYTHLTLPTN